MEKKIVIKKVLPLNDERASNEEKENSDNENQLPKKK